MTTLSPQTEDRLRLAFKRGNPFMLLLWRLGLGAWINAWPAVGGRILVLCHTGRKSGQPRRTPLNYACVDGEVYVVAGFGSTADWYRNVRADPRVEVWLPDGWWAGMAEDVTDPALRLPLVRQVLIGSGFAARLAGLDPRRMPDADLESATRSYCLMRIRRTAARTGPGGPGDLAWVWPLATFWLLLRRRRRR